MASYERIKILCVDDEPNILRTLQRFFRKDGFQVLTAASAAEAMLVLKEQGPVQVIISDFRMPGLNGVEFLKRVKLSCPATVGILLSGFSDLPMVAAAIDEQCVYRQLAKPWDREEMRQTVAEALLLHTGNQDIERSELLSGKLCRLDEDSCILTHDTP